MPEPETGNLQPVTIFAPHEKNHLLTNPVCSPKIPSAFQRSWFESRWGFLCRQPGRVPHLQKSLQEVFALRKGQPTSQCFMSILPFAGASPTDLALSEGENKFLFYSIACSAYRTRTLLYEAIRKAARREIHNG